MGEIRVESSDRNGLACHTERQMSTKRANGQGSLAKTGNSTWIARVSIDSKRINKTFSNHKEAAAWLSEIVRSREDGLGYDSAQTSFGEFIDMWLDIKKTQLRLATSFQYSETCRRYLKPRFGNEKLRDVTPAKIQAYYDQLLKNGKGKRTVQLINTILHGAFNHARRLGILASNPIDQVSAPRPVKREICVWNESQVNSFLIFVDSDVFYRLAFFTGMRQGEIFGLKWEDVHWKTKMLQVKRQVYKQTGLNWRFQEPKTSRGKRSIRLASGMLSSLRYQYDFTIPQMMRDAGDKWQDLNLIFPNAHGRPLDKWNVTKKFQKLSISAGLPRIRFHDIRHTCASLLLAHGEPPIRVAAMLGQSIEVLLSTYAHFIPDEDDGAALLMDEITTPIIIS